jgi:hypothetical protein
LTYVIKSGDSEDKEPVLGKSEVWRSLKIKQLRKVIQDDLGIVDKVSVKIFLNGEELTDDKLSVEESKILEEGASVDVMVTQKIAIEVYGKGKGYQCDVFVQPTEQIDVLKSKVHFFKTFIQRRHALYDKVSDKLLDDFSKTFKELDIKDGA